MLLMVDKSASTKNKMAPRLAAGRYPSLSLSMSKAVLAPSFSFSDTFRARKKDISDYPYMTALFTRIHVLSKLVKQSLFKN